jgi:hypothetical protein
MSDQAAFEQNVKSQQRVFYKAWKSVRRRRRRAQFCGGVVPRNSAAQFGGAIL